MCEINLKKKAAWIGAIAKAKAKSNNISGLVYVLFGSYSTHSTQLLDQRPGLDVLFAALCCAWMGKKFICPCCCATNQPLSIQRTPPPFLARLASYVMGTYGGGGGGVVPLHVSTCCF